MNKILLLIIFLIATGSCCFAQTKTTTQLSIGTEFGLPTGSYSGIYGSIFGGSVKLELPVKGNDLYFTITTGYSVLFKKITYNGPASNLLFLPLEAGGKYYFSKLGYVEGDFGVSEGVNSDFSGKRGFLYAPGIGFSAPTNKHKSTIDISLRYESRLESGTAINQIAARLSYRFSLKK